MALLNPIKLLSPTRFQSGAVLFKSYFNFIGQSEAPIAFHRWSLLGVIGTLLARSVYLPFGHSRVYPNQYILLTGGPGSRKGTAIRAAISLIEATGFDHFAPNKAAKEAIWAKMSQQTEEQFENLDFSLDSITEMFIAQDEFIDFIGIGNDDLVVNLTNLWDNLAKFSNPRNTKKDITITNPTFNILSGSAPGLISEAFSGVALSGGFFSRVLFIYGGYTDIKVTWPHKPDEQQKIQIVEHLKQIRELKGEIQLTAEVQTVLDRMYKTAPGIPDRRFNYYQQRRFTHLLKLVIICSAANLSLEPTVEDCILANTLLHLAELQMPYALGEYGKARHSDVANMVMDIIKSAHKPINTKELWKHINQDLDRQETLSELLINLLAAGKIQQVKKDNRVLGYLPIVEVNTSWEQGLIDYNLVEPDEHPGELTPDQQATQRST